MLIITYYWPPAGGPGVQRWLKFVKYLVELSFEPIVFIPENPNYPLIDASLLDEIPKGVRIIRQPIFEPYKWAAILSKQKAKQISSGIIQEYNKQSSLERLLLWVRGNFFIPDARKYWIKPSIRRLKKIIEEEKIQFVVTTGPPHSMHLIGKAIKESFPIKWIADFRDPWTSIGYHKKLMLTRDAQKKHKQLEKRVLRAADEIIVTSKTTRQEFIQLTTKPITVITNGYDGEPPRQELDQNFTISHIGSLLTDRNPQNFWKAIAELVQENDSFKSAIKVKLIGVIGYSVMKQIEDLDIEDYVEIIGYVSHNQVLKYQTQSQMLLLLEIDSEETRGIIPGKLFEYFNARRPIFAIGPKHWEAGEMVKAHEAGDYSMHSDKENIKKVLLKRFEQFKSGTLEINSKSIKQYHRFELTRKLAKSLTWESF